MSLDVYLSLDAPPTAPNGGSGIYVRRNGETVEISREEWDRAFPGQEPLVLSAEYGVDTTVYDRNITHNLGKMADAAGIYKHLWRPDEIGIERAKELIEPLAEGLAMLRADPDGFKIHNPENGWGNYEGLVAFVADYLEACRRYPEASVRASR
jgi:hypothetical protein